MPVAHTVCTLLRLVHAGSPEEDGQQNNGQDDGHDEKQAAGLAAGVLLVAGGAAELVVGAAGVVAHVGGVVLDGLQLLALLRNDLGDLLEEHVEVAHALLDLADLLLALSDEGLLEIDLVLGNNMDLFLLELELVLVLGGEVGGGMVGVGQKLGVDGGLGGAYGGALLLEGGALQGLELAEGGLELARDLLLGVSLRRL